MTTATITWQEKQKENKLSDADLSYRVNRRIAKWQKKTKLAEQARLTIAENEAELQQYADKPNGHKHKSLTRELADMKAFLADTEAEVAELNAALCDDMDRLVRDADKNRKAAENLKKAGNGNAAGKGGGGSAKSEESDPPAITDPPPAGEAQEVPEAITEEMKAELVCLNYTKEDIDDMDPAQAADIIKKKKGKSAASAPASGHGQQTGAGADTAASIPVMITSAMRQALHALGYTKEDIDAMRPEDANEILGAGIQKPVSSINDDTPAGAGAAAAPVVKLQPRRTEAAPATQKKKNQNALLVGVATAATFILGIFIGRKLK